MGTLFDFPANDVITPGSFEGMSDGYDMGDNKAKMLKHICDSERIATAHTLFVDDDLANVARFRAMGGAGLHVDYRTGISESDMRQIFRILNIAE